MYQNNLRSIVKRKYQATTDSSHKYPVAKNILGRNFTTNKENMVWISGIKYIATMQGWLYLTTVIGLFNRKR